jgi:lycopene cyclase domain-containing protein
MLESLDAVVSEWWRSATRWTISHAVPSSYSSDLTYLRFHLLFTLPLAALLGLALLVKSRLRHDPVRWFGLFLIGLVAFLTATPWDAYLVYRGVWSYLPSTNRIALSLF